MINDQKHTRSADTTHITHSHHILHANVYVCCAQFTQRARWYALTFIRDYDCVSIQLWVNESYTPSHVEKVTCLFWRHWKKINKIINSKCYIKISWKCLFFSHLGLFPFRQYRKKLKFPCFMCNTTKITKRLKYLRCPFQYSLSWESPWNFVGRNDW